MTLRDLVHTEFCWVDNVEARDETTQIFLIDALCSLPVDSCHIRNIREIHLRAQRADVLLESYGVEAVFVNKVQLLNAAIATPAPYLPLIKDNKALLRSQIDISNRATWKSNMFLNRGDSFRRVIFTKRDSFRSSYIFLFIPKLEQSLLNFAFQKLAVSLNSAPLK